MRKNQSIPASLTMLIITISIVALSQGAVHAQTATTNTSTSSANSAPDSTYHYNEATGLWENGTYSWDPNTGQTTPLQKQDYSYNPDTGMWDTKAYAYDQSTGTYVPNPKTTSQGPTGPTGPTSPTGTQGTTGTISKTGPTTTTGAKLSGLGTATEDPSTSGDPIIQNSVPASKNKSSTASKSTGVFDNFYDASISTRITSKAVSGDTTVDSNTNAGDSTTGNAAAIANLINLLQSYWNSGGGNLQTFSSDITGDVTGDLYIDPRVLQQAPSDPNPNGDVTINNQANGLIDNTIDLAAQSGSATVQNNTNGGNATTGNADAVANVVNMLNSMISSGQSFMGVINIYGNLDGDILLPQDVLNALLASNGGSTTGGSSLNLSNTDTQAISNHVNANATSGQATVDHNTSAGSATTGDSLTNLTILNLTGRQVIGKDSLLVFVNVLGRWVGVIMDAPQGATAAALGGGITTNDGIPTTGVGDVNLNNASNSQINNNINVAAQTGDASVRNNTSAGNASTGNATASVNLLNIINSNLSFSDWFGVLFINVFGNWVGSFGINTEAGNLPLAQAQSSSSAPAPVFSFSTAPEVSASKRITYYVYSKPITASDVQQAAQDSTNGETTRKGAGAILASSSGPGGGLSSPVNTSNSPANPWVLPIAGFIIGSLLLGGNQAYEFLQRRRLT